MPITEDIYALFLAIAKTHPVIGHNPAGGVYRFYGYNMDEANAGDRNKFSYPRMGLAMKTHAGLSGRIDNTGGALRNNLYAEIVLLKDAKSNEYADEMAAYALLFPVMMDIISWILNEALTVAECGPWPVIGLVDIGNITYTRVGPLGTGLGYGWKISILFKQMLQYTSDNPLNGLVPSP
ncbi:MAG: hypothetical protein JWO03_2866 [Bacteroidetes bacterium]|nr:hypothetical protein [Bacteroidota bacterium]